jgi:alanine transaminase
MLSSVVSRRFSVSPRRFKIQDISPGILRSEYAIEGPICIAADDIADQMSRGVRFPFQELIRCNIGNPFELGKKELSFPRQLIAAVQSSEVRNSNIFLPEVHERAKEFLASISGGLGAYSPGQGHLIIRQHIAEFITKRFGVESDPFNVLLTHGATVGMKRVFELFVANEKCGVIVPLPAFPAYQGMIHIRRGVVIPAYLDEATSWSLPLAELRRAHDEATLRGIDVRVLVLINPSNPTGAVMLRRELADILQFCDERGIVLVADEVYMDNIYTAERPFVSMRKVAAELGLKRIQIISLNSVSKGLLGECGQRGGYMEFHNFSKEFVAQVHKMSTMDQGSATVGQLLVDLLVRPPTSRECKEIWDRERAEELKSLAARGKWVADTVNSLPGMSCVPPAGAMYVFGKLHLPKKANKPFRRMGEEFGPDMGWCWQLLHKTGIVFVPGSGFGQVPGTNHFRVAFLPSEDRMKRLIHRLTKFQTDFMNEYGD